MTRAASAALTFIISVLPSLGSAQSRWPTQPGNAQSVEADVPLCRTRTPRITSDSIGPFNLHQTLGEIERVCARLDYGWGWSMGDKPFVRTRLGEIVVKIDLLDTLPSSAVYQVSTSSKSARTRDGFGPGSALVDLVRAWGKPTFSNDEVQIFASFASRPLLSFAVDAPLRYSDDSIELQLMSEISQARLPKDVLVGLTYLGPVPR